jgi:hypothetical protein
MYQITKHIWLGHSQDARNKLALDANKITACLNCAIDLDYECDRDVYKKVGLVDGPGNKIDTLALAMAELAELIKAEHKILVHCHSGMSRSVIVIAYYLAWKTNLSIYRALDMIATMKPAIYPHAALILLARHGHEGLEIEELLRKRVG